MGSLIISDAVSNGIKGTEIEVPEYNKQYVKLVAEANEQIKKGNERYAKAFVEAERFISD